MLKLLILTTIFCIVSSANLSAEISVETNVLKALFIHWERPVQITAMVCWKPSRSLNFLKSLVAYNASDPKSTFFITAIVEPSIDYLPSGSKFDEHQTVIIVDVACNQTQKLLVDADFYVYLKFAWIVLDTSEPNSMLAEESVEKIFGNLSVLASSEVFYFQKTVNGEFKIDQGNWSCLCFILNIFLCLLNHILGLQFTVIA
jgi:hypothetical protein